MEDLVCFEPDISIILSEYLLVRSDLMLVGDFSQYRFPALSRNLEAFRMSSSNARLYKFFLSLCLHLQL